jgi:hypothetical protein
MLADGFSPASEFIAAGSARSQNGRLRMPLKSGPLKMPDPPKKKRPAKPASIELAPRARLELAT